MPSPQPDLSDLIALFYRDAAECGAFVHVPSGDLPPVAARLLAHDHHMTVTVEAFHGCPVDVEVLETASPHGHYARKILLRRTSDREVVMFGIVRMNFAYVSDEVRSEIESGLIPLGRVLIDHNVLRKVELVDLWRITPGPDLRKWLNLSTSEEIYGRTALIHCDGEPAVELLEVVPTK